MNMGCVDLTNVFNFQDVGCFGLELSMKNWKDTYKTNG